MRGYAAGVVLLLTVSAFFFLGHPSIASSSAPPLCTDYSSKPILQDYDWKVFPPSNYTGFNVMYVEPDVIKVGSTYVMYVREQLNGSTVIAIFRGTSTNGANWTISPTPVLTTGPAGSWDSNVVFSPDVLWNGTGYMMYYVGSGSVLRQIGVAFSADGIHFTKYSGNPVITHGPGAYDDRYTRGPSVIFDGGIYKMWYSGNPQLNATNPFAAIDYATSPDGVHWTKFAGNPVFRGFAEYNTTIGIWPSVLKVNGTYVMAFSDEYYNIGLATSNDGLNWAFNNSTGLLETLGGWHNGQIGNPYIVLDGSRLLLWYSGLDNSNQTSPYVTGVGFSQCGVLVITPPVTTTVSLTSTIPATTTLVQTQTLTKSTSLTSVTTLTTVTNPTLPTYQLALSFVGGLVVAMIAAVALVWRKTRSGARPT